HADDGQCQQYRRGCPVDARRALSMDPAEGSLPVAVPSAAWVHLEPRRLPGDRDQFIEAGSSPRPLLSRMLLGADGTSLCSRRDESLLDRRARYPRPPRESSAVRPRDCTDCRHRVFCRRRVDAVPAWLGKAPRRADVVWWRSAKELSAGSWGQAEIADLLSTCLRRDRPGAFPSTSAPRCRAW